MRTLLILSLAVLTAGCMADGPPPEMSARAQEKLAEATEGRTPGQPVQCVQLRELRDNSSAGNDAIIFTTVHSDLIYVNRPPAGCPLDYGRSLVIRTTVGQLCRGDIVGVFDPVSGTHFGGCALGMFEPYRRPPR